MAVSEATFFRWKRKYGGLGPSELRHLRQVQEGNTELKKLVADLSLDKAMLQEVLARKLYRLVAGLSSTATCRTRSG